MSVLVAHAWRPAPPCGGVVSVDVAHLSRGECVRQGPSAFGILLLVLQPSGSPRRALLQT